MTFSFEPAHDAFLRSCADDDLASAPLLRDFDVLLDFVRPGAALTASKHLFSGPTLPVLNETLSRPLPVRFRRPQQRSFPYIHGLYALLRSTGLAFVDAREKTPLLRLDEEALASWKGLDPAERYFALFEAWLTRMDERALVDDRPDALGTLYRWLHFWREIPDEGLAVDKEQMGRLGLHPGLYNVALLDLFGFLDLADATTAEDDGWRLERLARRPLGDALLRLSSHLYDQVWARDNWLEPDEVWIDVPLREAFRRYFPSVRHGLELPGTTFQEGVFVFRVALGKPWRRLAVPAETLLYAFSGAILDAFEFEDHYHLDEFVVRNPFGRLVQIKHPECQDEPPYTDAVRVGDLPLRPGQRMRYVFDFGDWWEFDLQLEAIEPADPALTGPVLRASKGKPPQQYADADFE